MARGKPFPKGNKGRPVGAKNKVTQSMREAFKEAFDGMGGAEALMEWGMEPDNRGAFYSLASKLIPIEVTGKDGEELVLKFIQGAKPDA